MDDANTAAGMELLSPDKKITSAPTATPATPVQSPSTQTAPTQTAPVQTASEPTAAEHFGAGLIAGLHSALDIPAEFLARHVGGADEGAKIAANDVKTQADYEREHGYSTAAKAGHILGQLAVTVPATSPIGMLGRAAIGIPAVGRVGESLIDLGSGALQGAGAATMTGQNPLIGAAGGAAFPALAQGAGALGIGLTGNHLIARILHDKASSAGAAALGAWLSQSGGPVAMASGAAAAYGVKEAAKEYGPQIMRGVAQGVGTANDYGFPAAAGLAASSVTNHLLSPPRSGGYIDPSLTTGF